MNSRKSSSKRTDIGPVTERFPDFGLNADLLTAIGEMGWSVPSRIQANIIPLAIAGENIVARSRNGTGKTGAYVIPLLQCIDPTKPKTQAMILVASLELAQQVHTVVKRLSKHMKVTVLYSVDEREASSSPEHLLEVHILIGTPARLATLIDIKGVRLNECKTVVLDEADWLITKDMKFGCVTKVLNSLMGLPQMIFVTTTLPAYLDGVVKNYAPNTRIINVTSTNMNLRRVTHFYSKVNENDKFKRLMIVLKNYRYTRAMVFCRSNNRVNSLCHDLLEKGQDTICINARTWELLRSGSYMDLFDGISRVIVTCELFSRGMDIPCVDMIINYDLPWKPNEYLYRAGRCGRNGTSGSVISFIAPGDMNTMIRITEVHSFKIMPLVSKGYKRVQGRGQEHGQKHGKEHGQEHGQKHGQEHGKEHGQKHGQEHGEDKEKGDE